MSDAVRAHVRGSIIRRHRGSLTEGRGLDLTDGPSAPDDLSARIGQPKVLATTARPSQAMRSRS